MPPRIPAHYFDAALNRCTYCGVKGTHLGSGSWMFMGPAVCAAAPPPSCPVCRCATGSTSLVCVCNCHSAKPAPNQLILPFDWGDPGPEPKTPVMAPKCPDCQREWCEALDHYAGTDPDLASRCAGCRSKLQRGRRP